jgi:pimeloyl-ACP methyl ester carboxylesterase
MARLMVFVPGIRLKASAWQPLIQQLEEDPAWVADSQVLAWDHRTGILGRKPLLEIAAHLASEIGTRYALRAASGKPPFDDIVLVGHSMGALLVRQAYLIALGSTLNNMPPQPWAPLVSRIVLLAGVNSGVSLSRWQKLLAALVLSRKGTVHDILRGSDFITNLRLWWIRKLTTIERRPILVQLLGSRDNLVDREDSLDIEGFLEGHQFMVDGFDHLSLLIPGRGMRFDDTQYDILSLAILRNIPDDLTPPATYNPRQKVFFVVHGIRDCNNDWVEDVAKRISATFPGARVIAPDIGRFSALQFLTPSERNRYVRWFQGVYSQEFAKNPFASFNFVGHSYGTYLLGHGLRKLSGMKFDRVYLGGSVLPAEWPWDQHRTQITELRNSRASHDVPVGILCSALRGIGMKDIGTAGYTGFRLAFAEQSEWHFYQGGHDATIAEQTRPHIIGFLSEGFDFPQPTLERENPGFTRASAAAKILLPLILAFWMLFIALSAFWPPLEHAFHWAIGCFALFIVLLVGTTAFY